LLPGLRLHHLNEALDVEVLEPTPVQVGVHPVPRAVLVGGRDQAYQTAGRQPSVNSLKRLAHLSRLVLAVFPQLLVVEGEHYVPDEAH
jgi:hypothetical protein